MIDIIIPAYNAHKTILRTLGSILIQKELENIKVLIVDDFSDSDYSEIISKFKDLMNIQVVRLDENSGPGTCRRIGLEKTDSEYVTFIDADDTFADAWSISYLKQTLEKDNRTNVVIGGFNEELKSGNFYYHKDDMIWVFGKMYRREFLDKYHITFNDSRANEDGGFNTLCKLCNEDSINGLINCGKLVYFWHYNPLSITKNNDYTYNCFDGYTYNMAWAFNKAYELGPDNIKFSKLFSNCISNLMYLYFNSLVIQKTKTEEQYSKYIKWCTYYFKECFNKIKDNITNDMISDCYNQSMESNLYLLRDNKIIPNYTFDEFMSILSNTHK